MKIRLTPHQIYRITCGRYKDLHRNLLGYDLSDRSVMPIHRSIYYVDARERMGRQLIAENTPAKCIYSTGEIFCLYDERIPLTEARLVHEFVHRAARRKQFFVWVSGIDTRHGNTFLNEILTEYITKCIMKDRYMASVSSRNTYLPMLPQIEELEKKTSCRAIIEAYLTGNIRFFKNLSKKIKKL